MQTDKQAEAGVLEEFQVDLADCWQRLPNKGFFFFLLVVWLVLFQFLGNSTFGYYKTPSLFGWMWDVFTSRNPDGSMADDSIGLVVPLAVLALYWRKRKELTSLPLGMWWPGLLLAVFGMALHIAGYLIQQPRVSIVAMFVGIYGLMGLAWGADWLRKSFFPFFLFAFCVPFSTLIEPITFPLRLLACRIVESICHLVLSIDVVRNGTKLMDSAGRYQYDVAAACSGIRSLITISLAATVGAFLYFQKWRPRFLLIASAVPLAVIGNVVRLLTIIIAAEIGGRKAGDFVHEGGPLGIISLLPYVPAFLGLYAVRKLLLRHENREPKIA